MITKLVFGADLVPTNSNEKYFISGNIEYLVGEDIVNLLNDYDYVSFNLESPLTNCNLPIEKNGPALIADPRTINGICRLKPTLLTLGNNHILDYGVDGLKDTIKILNENNISYIGAGKNRNEARKPFIWEKNNLKIGVYNCTEHEFSVSKYNEYGANPYDPLDCYDDVLQLKKNCDITIVIYHGGKEHYRYPSPELQRYCRKFVEKGADLVLCQHSHCIGCKEDYKSGVIVYGQGNFLFDGNNNEYWDSSILVALNISEKFNVEYIPIMKYNDGIRLAHGVDKYYILKGFFDRSKKIKKSGFIEEEYSKFADKYFQNYLSILSGKRLFFRIINKISGGFFYKKLYSKKNMLALLNYIECEAHRELLIRGIKHEIEMK